MTDFSPSLSSHHDSFNASSPGATWHQSNRLIPPEEYGKADITPMNSSMQLKPMKSAIRNGVQQPSRCIPAMQSNGKVCAPSVGGYVSPQWGWYISTSTTPPTPEYSSKNQVLSHQMNTNHFQTAHRSGVHGNFLKQPWNPSTTPIQETSPKFSKGAPNYSSGWPTVPL